jgi:hypothetical protein
MKNGFYTFEDLEFKRKFFGVRARLFFDNGFGVSVIRIICSKSYALAVLEGNENNFKIWDDIATYLIPEEVTEYMIEVQKLERDKDEL